MATKKNRPKKTSKAAQRKAGKAKRSAVAGKAEAAAEAVTGKAEAAAEAVTGKAETPMSKSGFVRSMPDTPTKEIMRLYKEQFGEEITPGLIYNVRNSLKPKKTGKKTASAKVSRASTGSAVTRKKSNVAPVMSRDLSVDPKVVTQFRGAVLRMGLDRAETLFEQMRQSLGMDLETTSPRRAPRRSVQPSGEAATPG